jgi:hypothetical protein
VLAHSTSLGDRDNAGPAGSWATNTFPKKIETGLRLQDEQLTGTYDARMAESKVAPKPSTASIGFPW